jgi:hypothetical protein
MKYVFTILSVLFLPILSFKEIKPKLCVNCKYFITDNHCNIFGKCSLFPKEEKDIYSLVNGIHQDKNNEYFHCSVARKWEDMCGPEGKMYKKKILKRHLK